MPPIVFIVCVEHDDLIHYLATLLSIFLRQWNRPFLQIRLIGGKGEMEGTGWGKMASKGGRSYCES